MHNWQLLTNFDIYINNDNLHGPQKKNIKHVQWLFKPTNISLNSI
jgi:hypothetical protein